MLGPILRGEQAALETSGYGKIGRKRHCIYRVGAWHDVYILELLRDEWQARQG